MTLKVVETTTTNMKVIMLINNENCTIHSDLFKKCISYIRTLKERSLVAKINSPKHRLKNDKGRKNRN